MNSKRWQLVKTILDEAFDVDERELNEFLAGRCGDDACLLAEVQSLLQGRELAGRFLENPSWTISLHAPEELLETNRWDEDLRGARLGPYLVDEILGQGGMGSVYAATRADREYQRQVAIKVLKRGMNSDEIVWRFRTERQILASLSHPNIARLYDGATTADGRPYLVMEYVEGQPVDRYCDEHRLTVRERIAIFRAVCGAVDFAHRRLVVHRDLKPSNILVIRDGTPKLLDFGIAKLLDGDPESDWTHRSDLRIMTPSYASPEQLRGDLVTTASDTFSLGVLLYEILVGRRPFRSEGGGGIESTLRALEHQDIVPPSVAVSSRIPPQEDADGSTMTPEEIGHLRKASPSLLRRQLVGDLDSIVIKALSQEPTERYASAAELRADLECFSEGRPVSARRLTIWYQTAKYLRRRWYLPVAAAAGLLILVSVLFGAIQRSRAHEEMRRSQEERLRASLESRKAEELEEFLIEFLSGSDPTNESWRDASLRTVLDHGAELIPRELNTVPEVQTALMSTIGRVYQNLGLHRQARPLLVSSLEKRRELYGAEHEQVAYSEIHLGRLYSDLRQYDKAEELTRSGLGTLRTFGDDQEPWVISAENNLAAILQAKGDLVASEQLFRSVLDKKKAIHGQAHASVALGLHNLAAVLVLQGRLDEAEDCYRTAIAARRESGSDVTLGMAKTLSNFGALRQERGDFEGAVESLQESLELRRLLFPGDRGPLAIAFNNLGVAQLEMGDRSAAEMSLLKALEGLEESGSVGGLVYAVVLRNRAHLANESGDFDTARAYAARAVELLERLAGDNSWRAADARSVLGGAWAGLGSYEKAEIVLLESLEVLKPVADTRRRQYRQALERLTMLYQRWGKQEKARMVAAETVE